MSDARTTNGGTVASLRLAAAEGEGRSLREPASDPLRDSVVDFPSDYADGELIAGKYRLIRKLGEGGMGTVWVARNEALGVKVAIKLIGGGRTDTSYVARLSQEAQAAAQLGHPAIIRVFDFGKTDDGAPFIAMELLHGEDLATAIQRRGSLSEKRAVQTLLPVIHALAAAHDKGIVHRDLKPANIFLARTDGGGLQPKLLDFGVAKLDRDDFVRLTRDGVLLGSPAYMSPEQAQGEDVDRSADIWAVCVVLYEMITGNLPFNGENYHRLLWSIAQDEPAPTSTQFSGDPKLWAILERGFRKRRAHRWETMGDLGEELARWLFGTGCREDIAGVSLQATWLARRMSGADFLASDSEPPPSRPSGLVADPASLATLPNPSSQVETLDLPWKPSRRWLVVVAVVVLLTLALAAALFARANDKPDASVPNRVEGPAPPPTAATAVATSVPTPEPTPVAPPSPALNDETEQDASPSPSTASSPTARPAPPRPRPRSAGPKGRLKNPFD